MSKNDNYSRAKKVVDSWPSWKKEVSLTKHSTNSSKSSISGERAQNQSSSRRQVAEVSA